MSLFLFLFTLAIIHLGWLRVGYLALCFFSVSNNILS